MKMIQSTTGHWTFADVKYINYNSLLTNTFKPYFDFSRFVIPKMSFIMNNKQKSNKNTVIK